MKEKYNINQITKTLDKLFKAGYVNEKLIINMKMDDLMKIPKLITIEMYIIIEFKNAVKEKRVISFFSQSYKNSKKGTSDDINEKI